MHVTYLSTSDLIGACDLHHLQEDLFTHGGRPAEIEEIRDLLDTGGSHMPGTPPSVAAALLQFLEALAEPVVPATLHQKCMDGCNNVTLCKQVYKALLVGLGIG